MVNKKWYKRNRWVLGREELSTHDLYGAGDLSFFMDANLHEPLYVVRPEGEKAFNSRGVKIKALSFLVFSIVVFVLSYVYLEFNSLRNEDGIYNFVIFTPIFISLFFLLFYVLWWTSEYTKVTFVLCRVYEFFLCGSIAWSLACWAHDNDFVVPISASVVSAAVICILCSGFIMSRVNSRIQGFARVLVLTMIPVVLINLLVQGNRALGILSGLIVTVFAVASFFADLKAIEYFSSLNKLHNRYEWAAAFSLVLDIIFCIAGLLKSTNDNNE
ncbi:hypothetical protein EJ419_01070 [Alloscardovia theropitheci]|uniref:Bax inhibitor-1/YccA family protein n=1 Tax=Alloscardovia theropitheci TaxID=2496842 RepID=A0A4R0QZ39_9BIFI|nr:Bax inhibitor-1/YccA family protein [Alloscardovia theropitheci]TCD55011.1 hypothetical protein EJ419_01070 [Alloscardovia theropitheci]